jgi:type IV pilus assembly protein PilV
MLTFDTAATRSRGFTLLEVLITLIVLAIGMLGLANLQSKIHVTEFEAYQRAQAVLLLQSMVDRINTNRTQAANYVTTDPLGVGDTQPTSCTSLAVGRTRDQCEWSQSLKGAAEQQGTTDVGAMIGARGCVEQIQVANPATGVCTPGVYRVTIAWQGLHATVTPNLTCGQGNYGDENMRRVVSARVTISLNSCSLT